MTTDWKEAHAALVRLAARRAEHDYEEATWLVQGERVAVHARLGFGSYREYLERLFGYGPREAEERLRVARSLAGLPLLAEELRDGRVCWSAARELTRVVTAETEPAWVEAAAGKTVREVERMVSGRAAGQLPSEPARPEVERHVLRFEVDGETYAAWREAVKRVREEQGGRLSEDDALLAIARRVLEGPGDEGRASYQVHVTVCEQCGAGTVDGRGEPVAVTADVLEMAACDAQHVPTHVGDRATQTIPPAKRRAVVRRDHGRCVVNGCRAASFIDIHHIDRRTDGGQHEPDKMISRCGVHHRAAHAGRLVISGTVSAGLSFHHADGSRYGSVAVHPARAEAMETAFRGLVSLGFKERDARRALATPSLDNGVGEATPAEMIRAALRLLTWRHLRRAGAGGDPERWLTGAAQRVRSRPTHVSQWLAARRHASSLER